LENDKSPFILDNLKDDTGFLMLQVSNLWSNSHDRALKKYHGLSHMQYAVLASVCWLVYHSDKPVTQSFLAQHTKISPMTISQIFKVLEARGYIIRTKHPTDVRSKIVKLTDEGNELMHQAVLTIWDVDSKFFKVLGKNTKRFNGYLHELLMVND
jgi:DNA-binding MarR family transcriptional regulator